MHTATRLPNGKILVAGGQASGACEVYDPATQTWATTGSMSTPRYAHTATLLPTGKVLAVGGYNSTTYYASAEIYDPETGKWSATGAMPTAHSTHTATLLPSGKVLVVGGKNSSKAVSDAQLYDPATGLWTAQRSLLTARTGHTASLLPTGDILVAGGSNLSTAELYNTTTGLWTATGSMPSARQSHSAVVLSDGNVLVAGNASSTTSAAIYNTTKKIWAAAPAMTVARGLTTATMLPNGKVLIANGNSSGATAEIFDPFTNTWASSAYAATSRSNNTATLLPNGLVLFAGGTNASYTLISSAELYNYGQPTAGTWRDTGTKQHEAIAESKVLLPNGNILKAGGYTVDYTGKRSSSPAEIYNSITNTWSTVAQPYSNHSFTKLVLLPNGKVLLAGGNNAIGIETPNNTAEIYDPVNNKWTIAADMLSPCADTVPTILNNGKVFVMGYYSGVMSAEIYDYITNTWSVAQLPNDSNVFSYTITLLLNGKILLSGGYTQTGGHSVISLNPQIYDPSTNTWSFTGPLSFGTVGGSTSLLSNGNVMVAGGTPGDGMGNFLSSVQIYNTYTNTWSISTPLPSSLVYQTSVQLKDGKIMLIGGVDNTKNYSHNVFIYNPYINTWETTTNTYYIYANVEPSYTTNAFLLPNNNVVMFSASPQIGGNIEIYTPGQ